MDPGPEDSQYVEISGPGASMYVEPTPEDLLRRFVEGEEAAFGELVDLVGDRLFGFLCRYLGDHHAAEDVYQAVLVKVAVHAAAFDQRARFNTWLYRIARNAAVDHFRKSARRKAVSLDRELNEDDRATLMDELVVSDRPPHAEMTEEELGARIADAVELLPDEQREVFVLKENADLTFDEIGEMLGCGKETAKSRMRYALKRLRNALGAEARLYGLMS